MIEPFFIPDMQTAHNGYAVYCLAKMLQCSYLTFNGNKPPVANTRPVFLPVHWLAFKKASDMQTGVFFVSNAQQRARHALGSLATSA